MQVFRGRETKSMVVGQRRLVVVDAKPTPSTPHRGVVTWVAQLENVGDINLRFEAPTSGCDAASSMGLCVLRVHLKQGDDFEFPLGFQESCTLIKSIHQRLKGETPTPSTIASAAAAILSPNHAPRAPR